MAKYQTTDPFTRIPNTAVNDPTLDLKALGLLVFMLSKPDGWRFTERNLADQTGVSRNQIRTAMSVLIDSGYVIRSTVMEAGRPTSVTQVYDQPPGTESEPPPGVPNRDQTLVPNRDRPESVPVSNNGGVVTKEVVTKEVSADADVHEPTTAVAAAGWEQARDLCEYLADAIVDGSVADVKRPKVTRRWIADMEQMIRLDGRDPDSVRRCIDWAHRGPGSQGNGARWNGWGAVVRCPDKLRAQYDQMAEQAARKARPPDGTAMAEAHRVMSGRTSTVRLAL